MDDEKRTVWVVRFGNYYPAEIDAIFATKELAERHAQALGDTYGAEEWEVQTNATEGDKEP